MTNSLNNLASLRNEGEQPEGKKREDGNDNTFELTRNNSKKKRERVSKVSSNDSTTGPLSMPALWERRGGQDVIRELIKRGRGKGERSNEALPGSPLRR